MDLSPELQEHLDFLYGAEAGASAGRELGEILAGYAPPSAVPPSLDERDAVLITYGDQLQRGGEPPLRTLAEFCERRLKGLVTGVHILPFYPSTSDDGFSVSDYFQVDPSLGSWADVTRLGGSFRLMFDAVVNHVSKSSDWFQEYLRGSERYRDYFIECDPAVDLSAVVRPRTLPLLTHFQTAAGGKWIWTTFSADQVDLNYHNPRVLLDVSRALLEYVSRGAQIIRLDAIAYLWKEIGTSCIHLEKTHRVVRFFRSLLDRVAPYVILITETNVPHQDNISYFGNGRNEAQLVYNFALPPLVLHAVLTGSAARLSQWASGLEIPSPRTTFFNFLASHDGIGLNPARGLLAGAEIDALVDVVRKHGGLVSHKTNPDGSQSPYELNVSYFDALSDPNAAEPEATRVRRFLAAQAVLLSLAGLPGIYVHSLLGSRNWIEGVRQTNRYRTINRQKFDLAALEIELDSPSTRRSQVLVGYRTLLRARASTPAFHPYGSQRVLACSADGVFALLRRSPDGRHRAVCLHNLSDRPCDVRLNDLNLDQPSRRYRHLFGGQPVDLCRDQSLRLEPYEVAWFSPEDG